MSYTPTPIAIQRDVRCVHMCTTYTMFHINKQYNGNIVYMSMTEHGLLLLFIACIGMVAVKGKILI